MVRVTPGLGMVKAVGSQRSTFGGGFFMNRSHTPNDAVKLVKEGMRLAFTVIFASASHDTLENTHEDHPASRTSILA
jgi:hypothetical protein